MSSLKLRLARQSARTLSAAMPVWGKAMAADVRARMLCDVAMGLFRHAALPGEFSITVIGLAASKFEAGATQQRSLTAMLQKQLSPSTATATKPSKLAAYILLL